MEEDILDVIQKIQEARSPKYFLWNIIKNVKWVEYETIPNVVHGELNDLVYFYYDVEKKILHYNYFEIYLILKDMYNLNENHSSLLVLEMLKKHTDFDITHIFNILPSQKPC